MSNTSRAAIYRSMRAAFMQDARAIWALTPTARHWRRDYVRRARRANWLLVALLRGDRPRALELAGLRGV